MCTWWWLVRRKSKMFKKQDNYCFLILKDINNCSDQCLMAEYFLSQIRGSQKWVNKKQELPSTFKEEEEEEKVEIDRPASSGGEVKYMKIR